MAENDAAAAPAPEAAPPAPAEAPSPPPAPTVLIPDNVDFISGGRIVVVVAGRKYQLRAPTMPEAQACRDVHEALVAANRKAIMEEQKNLDQTEELRALFIDIINSFGDATYEADRAKEPPWLGNVRLFPRIWEHWTAVPGM